MFHFPIHFRRDKIEDLITINLPTYLDEMKVPSKMQAIETLNFNA